MFAKIQKASDDFLLTASKRGRLYVERRMTRGGMIGPTQHTGKVAREILTSCACHANGGAFCLCYMLGDAARDIKNGKLFVKVAE